MVAYGRRLKSQSFREKHLLVFHSFNPWDFGQLEIWIGLERARRIVSYTYKLTNYWEFCSTCLATILAVHDFQSRWRGALWLFRVPQLHQLHGESSVSPLICICCWIVNWVATCNGFRDLKPEICFIGHWLWSTHYTNTSEKPGSVDTNA